jgi:hypothetical protein
MWRDKAGGENPCVMAFVGIWPLLRGVRRHGVAWVQRSVIAGGIAMNHISRFQAASHQLEVLSRYS